MKPTTIIYAVALSLSLVINSIMITDSFTRRSADELGKIKLSEMNEQLVCKQNGGVLQYADNGDFMNCKYK